MSEERLLAGVAALDIVVWEHKRAVKKTAGVLRAMQAPWELLNSVTVLQARRRCFKLEGVNSTEKSGGLQGQGNLSGEEEVPCTLASNANTSQTDK